MLSPLAKRFPRELKSNLGKYLGIFFMMVMAIGLTSGFLVAASSISKIIDKMDDAYLIEDARFTTNFEASSKALSAARQAAQDSSGSPAHIYKNYSIDTPFSGGEAAEGTTARVYQNRTNVNLAAYVEGSEPANEHEIALDRVFCTHNNIHVGDTVTAGGVDFTVSGIMTLPDYSALFQKNSDFVFDSLTFTVATVSDKGFSAIEKTGSSPTTYTYSVRFDDRTLSDADRVNAESDMAEALAGHNAVLSDLTDKAANQGIGYPADDVEGDQAMWKTLMLMLIVIMAFMFVVLTTSTIEEESAIIGTLLASGWRKRELMLHYAALPCLVGIVAAVIGNIVGYIALAEPMKNLYYNSYSLPPYYATWDWDVFLITTAAPLALLIGITFLGLARKMRCTPLQFLRHETSCGGTKHGFALPEQLGFATRFRLRVFLRDFGNFATLFFGIAFASMLLLFGLCVLPTMDNYAESLKSDVVAEHMYTLKAPLEIDGTNSERNAYAAAEKLTDVQDIGDLGLGAADTLSLLLQASTIDEDAHPVNTQKISQAAIGQAEKYAAASLEYDRGDDLGTEQVTVYGIQPDSKYWTGLNLSSNQIAASQGMIDKFSLEDGAQIPLNDKYEGKDYTFNLTGGSYGSESAIALYMPLDEFNRVFGNDADYFNGYASNMELPLDSRYVASEMTPADMDKIGAQMTSSMGDMMDMMLFVAVSIFLIFMYLLTKTVIDRSARAISYLKVFGYRDGEINKLYIRSITWTVVISIFACMPIIIASLGAIFKAMLMSYSGNIVVYVPPSAMAECAVTALITYAVVAFMHTRRIKRVPMALALKVQE